MQHLAAETWVEGLVDADVFLQGHVGEVELLRYDEQFLEHFGATEHGLHAIDLDCSLARPEETGNEVEQCALTCSVLAQKAVDVILCELQAEVVEDFRLLACVAETDVLNIDHDFYFLGVKEEG